MAADIGIDLGTANCCVAVWRDGGVEVIPDELGHRTFPSWISFGSSGCVEVGHSALYRARIDPANSVYNVMQLIGKKRKDIIHLIDKLPYQIIESDGRLKIIVLHEGRECSFFPEELLAIILSKIKQMCENHLKCSVRSAVISCPHCFNIFQMRALVTAAKLAGINRCSLSTPSALAALAFTKQNHFQLGHGSSFVVFCMGSHYVESSVVRIEQDESCTVLYGAGSSECGGDSLTDVLMDHIRDHLKSNISTDSKTMLILRRECESIKKSLSASSVAYFPVSSVSDDDSRIFTVQKELFESKCANQFYSAVVSINDVDSFIKDHDLEVNDVIIAGGSTRIPQIQQLLFKTFGRNPNKMLNLDEAVAIGAAYKAAAHDGAASLSEIIHHSIGIKTEDGHITPILRKNENYPAVNEVVFHRSHDSDRHESVIIDVYEGDNADLRGNTSLEKFSCDSLASRIKITLALNDFYELEMIVMDMESDSVILKEDNVCMKHFSKDEIEFMTFRNINFANQTREKLKCMEAMNQLEEFIIHIKSSNVDDEDLIHHCDEVLEVLGNKDSILTVDKVELFRVKLQHEFEQHKAAARRANEVTVSIRVFDSNQGRCAAGLNVLLESHYSRIKDILATGVTDDKGELSLCVPFEKFNQGGSFVRLVVLGIDTYYQSHCGYPSVETIFFLEAVPDCQPQWTITFSLSAFNYNVNMTKRAAS